MNNSGSQSLTKHPEVQAGALTALAIFCALLFANLPDTRDLYWSFHHAEFHIGIEDFRIRQPLVLWINDGLMTFFFLLIGFELKYEFVLGNLENRKDWFIPIVVAVTGVAMPALIFIAINWNDEPALRGWAIPSATDTILALSAIKIFRHRITGAAIALLLSLAVIDDVIAVVITAIFYSSDLNLPVLLASLPVMGVLYFFLRNGFGSMKLYAVPMLLLWVLFAKGGIHPTIAGVVTALFYPVQRRRGMLKRILAAHKPWVYWVIVPTFAFFNAGVAINLGEPAKLFTPVFWGVALGLLVGKLLGISGSLLSVKHLMPNSILRHVGPMECVVIGLFASVGFTMSLFLASLSYSDANVLQSARLGILTASFVGMVLGCVFIRCYLAAPKHLGADYVSENAKN